MTNKAPIGKILIEKKKIDEDGLSRALDRQKLSGDRLASSLLELGLAGEEDLLGALGEQLGLPAVDLSASVIPLGHLDLIPQQVAEQSKVMPLTVEENRVGLAMANPDDQQTIDEVSFVTGKKVDPFVVLESRLKKVIREAYALHKRDPGIRFYQGERGMFPDNQESPEGYIAVIAQQLPEVEVPVEPDEELITIEVSAEDEIPVQGGTGQAEDAQQTVLVIDDEPDIVRLLEKSLTAEGFRVVSATRGLQALQEVKSKAPDLVLLDAMLPEIHGFEICKKIKSSKRFGHIPVVMISAVYKGWRYAEDVKQTYGADDYFEKPFRIVPLVRRVRELLKAGPADAESQLDPDAADRSYRQGVELYKQKKYEEAEGHLREAVNLDPFSPNIHYALANILLARNQVYDAIREYEQTVELQPDLFVPLRNLAILYQKKGFRNKAVEMWERALRCSPDEQTRKQVREQLLKLL